MSGFVIGDGATVTANATNRSEDVDLTSGNADATNQASTFVGQVEAGGVTVSTDDITLSPASNVQEGDNSHVLDQVAEAFTGDAVGGQVIGVVASSGSVDITADNETIDADVVTGNANALNEGDSLVGQADTGDAPFGGNVNVLANSRSVSTAASSSIGATPVPLGSTPTSGGTSATTTGSGDALSGAASGDAGSSGAQTTGLVSSELGSLATASRASGEPAIEDITDSPASNVQEGSNSMTLTQDQDVQTGDGVAGQVIGVVSSGDTVVDATNTTEDADVETGAADTTNDSSAFVGLVQADDVNVETGVADISGSPADNVQEGSSDLRLTQSIDASSGDGVAGQVIGIVTSGGGSSDVTASNSSEDVDATTGFAGAANNAESFVGFIDGASVNVGDITDSPADYVQEGDDDADIEQSIVIASGDGVGGQVIGVVSAGDTAVDATNATTDVDLETGSIDFVQDADSFVGLADSDEEVDIGDISGSPANDVQEGSNALTLAQTATVATGDAVGGQVVGIVTAAGGTSDVTASNTSEDVDAVTGSIEGSTDASTFVGLASALTDITVGDIDSSGGINIQEGDNTAVVDQTTDASSGDAVGGQVIGVVSAGEAVVDATNETTDADLETGGVRPVNEAASFVGHASSDFGWIEVSASDITNSGGENVQEGDNDLTISQAIAAASGDAVGGQVIGIVTAAAGSAGVTASNTSEDVDLETGSVTAFNDAETFVGLAETDNLGVSVSDITGSDSENVQEGDNSADIASAVDASSGDAVGGQVIGVVSAGDTTIDATNDSEDIDASTGLVDVANDPDTFVGIVDGDFGGVDIGDIDNVAGTSIQEGDNDYTLRQDLAAASGDAVSGQVIGVVTSAGGSADVTADNSSTDVDALTGNVLGENDAEILVGLAEANATIAINDISNVESGNLQEGDNTATIDQSMDLASGDAVGGQVIGIVSAGDTVVDATNASEDIDVETGPVDDGDNAAVALVGHAREIDEGGIEVSDITDSESRNVQEGDNDLTVDQDLTAATGDAVGGQVIGVVTSAGGSADITADNTSEDVDAVTGFADAGNTAELLVGLAHTNGRIAVSDISNVTGSLNLQEGSNEADIDQSMDAASGDAVGGQVIGVVSAGAVAIDATNSSEDVDALTGGAATENTTEGIVGHAFADGVIQVTDVTGSPSGNLQEGENSLSLTQVASAASGDAVGGQVIGAVASAGGSADITADNTSDDVDLETGEARADNASAQAVGLLIGADDVTIADITDSGESGNLHEGDNDAVIGQTADAASGDAVGGQVVGVVSAGDVTVDATNATEDADVLTGVATAENDSSTFVGLGFSNTASVFVFDIVDSTAAHVQEGSNELVIDQSAAAATGDGVGGQVIGVVASSGGSADVTASNTSEDTDLVTGTANAFNDAQSSVGLVGAPNSVDIGDITRSGFRLTQEGSNGADVGQVADASSGDAVGGQVIGVVSDGAASIDATNASSDIDITTGTAAADDVSSAIVGLSGALFGAIAVGDIDGSNPTHSVQEGDNDLVLDQAASASSGDGVGGQVIGVVASAGGSVDIIADNSSEDIDAETGDAAADNFASSLVGHAATEAGIAVADITGSSAANVQEGDNELNGSQTADAASGDAVGGQVLGVVGSGDVSVAATSSSEDVDLSTGNADAENDAVTLVGLFAAGDTVDGGGVVISDLDGVFGVNVQEGSNAASFGQTSDAASGDAVGGQVVGIVAAGSADLTLDNATVDGDTTTGTATDANLSRLIIGLAVGNATILIGG